MELVREQCAQGLNEVRPLHRVWYDDPIWRANHDGSADDHSQCPVWSEGAASGIAHQRVGEQQGFHPRQRQPPFLDLHGSIQATMKLQQTGLGIDGDGITEDSAAAVRV